MPGTTTGICENTGFSKASVADINDQLRTLSLAPQVKNKLPSSNTKDSLAVILIDLAAWSFISQSDCQDVQAMSENFATWYQLIMYNAIRPVDGGDAHGNKYSFSSIAVYVRLENIGKWYAAIHPRLRAVEAVWGTPIISVDISAEITEAKLHHEFSAGNREIQYVYVTDAPESHKTPYWTYVPYHNQVISAIFQRYQYPNRKTAFEKILTVAYQCGLIEHIDIVLPQFRRWCNRERSRDPLPPACNAAEGRELRKIRDDVDVEAEDATAEMDDVDLMDD